MREMPCAWLQHARASWRSRSSDSPGRIWRVCRRPLRDTLASLARRLAGWFDGGRRPDWPWFEDVLTYDNARLAQALIAAGHRLGDRDLPVPGSRGARLVRGRCGVGSGRPSGWWATAGGGRAEPTLPWAEEGDEQPLDAAALVEALVEAYLATGEDRYGRQAVRAFEWFLGRNHLGVAVYDAATGGCHDGLGPDGLNANEGAESTLAYLQAALALDEAGLRSVSACRGMKVALLGPIAWRTPPRHYGPWEQVTSLLAEGLVREGVDVTLFATLDSMTAAALDGVAPAAYSEDASLDGRIWEALHVSHALSRSAEFDLVHNHLDWLPLAFSAHCRAPLVTTIHGFSSSRILPAYQRAPSAYVSISDADRSPDLDYCGTVYHGIDLDSVAFSAAGGDRLVILGRIHPDKGTAHGDRDRPAGRAGSGDRRADPGPGLLRPLRGAADRWRPGALPRIGRAVGALRPARRSARPAAPHRLRGAVRPVGGRGDGGRHTGDRVLAGFDAGDHRGRRHRVPGLGSDCRGGRSRCCPDAGPKRRSGRWPRPGSAPSGW